ncbi:MAG: DUF6067 family protein [Abditibacteriales bacterium]|nr:DUF6067 family protein [Abditibacteriales bacterium]MDW8364547.1 DUF6067 family protein [Abditibacteriales bacterium]
MNAMMCWLLLSWAAAGLSETRWHHPLYLANDGYWRQRVQVVVRNDADRAVAGEPVTVKIGRGVGEINLVGTRAEAVRVCDAAGAEMLFDLTAPNGQRIAQGVIPSGSVLTIPAECAPRGTATYFVYFDNPSAWRVPDFLDAAVEVRNGSVEEGTGDTPFGWRHDEPDAQHQTFWVAEHPRSGKRCLKTVVADGAEPTWIATRQMNIRVIGGARYVLRAWVRAENVRGYAGWYVHVGNAQDPMRLNRVFNAGGGSYDWKEIVAEFTAPPDANVASLGTVLWGSGTAWFDDVSLECLDAIPPLTARAGKVERLQLQELGAGAKWFDDNPHDGLTWDCRAPIKVMNLSPQATKTLVYVDVTPLTARLGSRLNKESLRLTDGKRWLPYYRLGEGVLFEAHLPPRTVRTFYAYLSFDPRLKAATTGTPVVPSAAQRSQHRGLLPLARNDSPTLSYADLLNSERNLVKNPSFEIGDALPDDWRGGAEGERPAGTTLGLDEPGLFGKRCAKTFIPRDAQKAWTGWRQDVPVEPGKTYLFSAWLKCQDLEGGLQLHAHYRNAAGELCATQKYTSAGPAISGTQDWTLMFGMFTMPPDIAHFQLHLTMLATGTAWHDGVVLAEVTRAVVGPLESLPSKDVIAWQVNAIVKVFQDDVPPRDRTHTIGVTRDAVVGSVAARGTPFRITAARNEKEPLQIAVRSPRPIKQVAVEVDAPVHASGARLTDVQVSIVGYVPVDHPSNYYSASSPAWHRKYPQGASGCDGWAGMWPDPLLPRKTFDLPANVTQPIWLTVSVPKDAAAGDYKGKVRLTANGATVKEMPFTVHVWDFTLPDESHVKAIYDVRMGGAWWALPGKTPTQVREELWRFMAERRVCPDTIRPEPLFKYENGKVTADFTAFDKAAEYYFNVLKFPHAYTPWHFYLFGWGHPPARKFGEEPYAGAYPYTDADRRQLRPEFKRAYQACLRVFWQHLKEKGWDKNVVLYISDEPYFSQRHIIDQMQALCAMIHDVDPAIPIYASTWHHVPEWDAALDVWGIGHHGIVPLPQIERLRAAGKRIWWTTDGQMCLDTPACAIERLLPHYCFHYDAEAYEFWGIDWLTYNPYEFGWHSYIQQSGQPGESTWVRYPNGDGYLVYPGGPVGYNGIVSSVRLEQVREGVEDYEYLYLLRSLIAQAKAAGRDASAGEKALALASQLVSIPNAGGRYATRILPNPDAVLEVKETVARAIEGLR